MMFDGDGEIELIPFYLLFLYDTTLAPQSQYFFSDKTIVIFRHDSKKFGRVLTTAESML